MGGGGGGAEAIGEEGLLEEEELGGGQMGKETFLQRASLLVFVLPRALWPPCHSLASHITYPNVLQGDHDGYNFQKIVKQAMLYR